MKSLFKKKKWITIKAVRKNKKPTKSKIPTGIVPVRYGSNINLVRAKSQKAALKQLPRLKF